MKAAVIGYGYWGEKITRNCVELLGLENVAVFDCDPAALTRAKDTYSGIETTTDVYSAFSRSDISFTAIITPVATHYELASAALTAGKHVFLEKPMTEHSWQAAQLLKLATQMNRMVMIDHTFLFTDAIHVIKDILGDDIIGTPVFIDSRRVNFGIMQPDVDVLYDLAPHDLAILRYLIDDCPQECHAQMLDPLGHGKGTIANITLTYPDLAAQFAISWLSPVKVRQFTIVGTRGLLVWDHLNAEQPVKVYGNADLHTSSHDEVYIPYVENREPLNAELSYFLSCMHTGTHPTLNTAVHGLQIVEMLEALTASQSSERLLLCK